MLPFFSFYLKLLRIRKKTLETKLNSCLITSCSQATVTKTSGMYLLSFPTIHVNSTLYCIFLCTDIYLGIYFANFFAFLISNTKISIKMLLTSMHTYDRLVYFDCSIAYVNNPQLEHFPLRRPTRFP